MSWQSLDTIIQNIDKLSYSDIKGLPRGRIDITIHSNGDWSYGGTKIQRLEMVKLFSEQLLKVEDQYYLIAPEQLLNISVEDMPFVVISADRKTINGRVEISLRTSSNHSFLFDETHEAILQPIKGSEGQVPCVLVRDNLLARFDRPVYYQMVSWGEQVALAGRQVLTINSCGQNHVFGYL